MSITHGIEKGAVDILTAFCVAKQLMRENSSDDPEVLARLSTMRATVNEFELRVERMRTLRSTTQARNVELARCQSVFELVLRELKSEKSRTPHESAAGRMDGS